MTVRIGATRTQACSRWALVSALLVVFLGTAPNADSAAAASSEHIPEIAGTTSIVFDGTSGIRLRVPADIELTKDDFHFDVTGTEAAFGHIGPLDAPCKSVFPSDDTWCFDYSFQIMDGWYLSPYISRPPRDPVVTAGRVDIYMVTTGRVVLTLSAPELDGEAVYAATGQLDGAVIQHPVHCLNEDTANTGCDYQGWGGHQFQAIEPTAVVGSSSYTQRPNILKAAGLPTPGTIGVGSCIYPSVTEPEKSPDPAEHPRGCDTDDQGWHGAQTFMNTYLTRAVQPLWVTYAHLRKELIQAGGPRYTGFGAHQVESAEAIEGPGAFGSWGYWYSRDIGCPTGNWTSCG